MKRLFSIVLFCVLGSAGKSFALPPCPGIFSSVFRFLHIHQWSQIRWGIQKRREARPRHHDMGQWKQVRRDIQGRRSVERY